MSKESRKADKIAQMTNLYFRPPVDSRPLKEKMADMKAKREKAQAIGQNIGRNKRT